jgi:hypothetical protein
MVLGSHGPQKFDPMLFTDCIKLKQQNRSMMFVPSFIKARRLIQKFL